jgi:hypothetical protein
MSALMAATIQYVELIKRRNSVRELAALREESAEVGLRALVRVFLADASDTHDRRYLPE